MLSKYLKRLNIEEKNSYIGISITFLLSSMALSLISNEIPILDFISGILMGIATVFGIAGLYYFGKSFRSKNQKKSTKSESETE